VAQVYKRDGKRAVYCAQGWNAALSLDAAAAGSYDVAVVGYPHVMPSLRGAPLRAFCRAASAAGCCVALDVNEAFDAADAPLGAAPDAYADVGVFHGNLDEAAACAGAKTRLLAAAGAADSLEAAVDRAAVRAVAAALARRGAGLVLITLGPRGAYGAAGDAATLRRALGRACPADVSKLAGASCFRAAFAVDGRVNSVGAGDAFLAGCVAALLGGAADLPTILDLGLASACFKVDDARGAAPPARDLRALLPSLARLPPFPGSDDD